MGDFGVELQSIDRQLVMLDRGDRARRSSCDDFKPLGNQVDLVAVAHPNIDFGGKARKEFFQIADLQPSASKFPRGTRFYGPPEAMSSELHSVANPKNRDSERKQLGVATRGTLVVDTRWAARQDDG